jgi:hypothetical protein
MEVQKLWWFIPNTLGICAVSVNELRWGHYFPWLLMCNLFYSLDRPKLENRTEPSQSQEIDLR